MVLQELRNDYFLSFVKFYVLVNCWFTSYCNSTNKMILKDITEESLKLLDECKEDKITIFVSGGGGKVSVLQQMLYIINSDPGKFTIVTAESNDSCNLLLLLLVKCKVVVLSEARGGYHHTYQVREINSQGNPRDYYEKFMLEEIAKFRKQELRMIKELELTEEEIERVERGAFVYFHSDRLKELIKKDWSWFFEDPVTITPDTTTVFRWW